MRRRRKRNPAHKTTTGERALLVGGTLGLALFGAPLLATAIAAAITVYTWNRQPF